MGNLLSKRRSKRSGKKKRRKHGNDLHNDEAFETEHATFEGTFLNCSFETRNPSQVEITPEEDSRTHACNCSLENRICVDQRYFKALKIEVLTLRRILDSSNKEPAASKVAPVTDEILSNTKLSSTSSLDSDTPYDINSPLGIKLRQVHMKKSNRQSSYCDIVAAEQKANKPTQQQQEKTANGATSSHSEEARKNNVVKRKSGVIQTQNHTVGDAAFEFPSDFPKCTRTVYRAKIDKTNVDKSTLFSKSTPEYTVSDTEAETSSNEKSEPKNKAPSTRSEKDNFPPTFGHFENESQSSIIKVASSTATLKGGENGSSHPVETKPEDTVAAINTCPCIVCDQSILKDEHVLNFMADTSGSSKEAVSSSGVKLEAQGDTDDSGSTDKAVDSGSDDSDEYENVREVASDNLKLYFKDAPFQSNETSSCIQIKTENVY